MEKIYGYKEKDVIGLAEFIKNRGNKSLSHVFESYAIKSKKAKGTVRNLYYALAKLSNKDKEFCNKYLDGNALKVESIVEFGQDAQRELIKKVLLGRQQGRSVRSTVMEMANGDGKLALRYQNKYRNAVKSKPKLISEIIAEIKGDREVLFGNEQTNFSDGKTNFLIDRSISKINKEISTLVLKSNYKIRKENQQLKEKIEILEKENQAINRLLYSNNGYKSVLEIFNKTNGKSLPS